MISLGQYFCLAAGAALFVFGVGNVVVHFVYGIESIRGTSEYTWDIIT
jgi:hypothetical protein